MQRMGRAWKERVCLLPCAMPLAQIKSYTNRCARLENDAPRGSWAHTLDNVNLSLSLSLSPAHTLRSLPTSAACCPPPPARALEGHCGGVVGLRAGRSPALSPRHPAPRAPCALRQLPRHAPPRLHGLRRRGRLGGELRPAAGAEAAGGLCIRGAADVQLRGAGRGADHRGPIQRPCRQVSRRRGAAGLSRRGPTCGRYARQGSVFLLCKTTMRGGWEGHRARGCVVAAFDGSLARVVHTFLIPITSPPSPRQWSTTSTCGSSSC